MMASPKQNILCRPVVSPFQLFIGLVAAVFVLRLYATSQRAATPYEPAPQRPERNATGGPAMPAGQPATRAPNTTQAPAAAAPNTTAPKGGTAPPPPQPAAAGGWDTKPLIAHAASRHHADARHWLDAELRTWAARYGRPDQRCDQLFGEAHLKAWRARAVPFCTSSSSGNGSRSANTGASTITLYPRHNSLPKKWALPGESWNVVLDSAGYIGTAASEQLKHDFSGAKPVQGSLRAACAFDAAMKGVPEPNAADPVAQRWIKTALVSDPKVAEICAAKAYATPILLISRYDATNAYHFMEDVITAFMHLLLSDSEDIRKQGIQVVLADATIPGFYPEVWARISHPHPVITLREQPFPPGTCFRHVLHGAHAGFSLLSYQGVGAKQACASPLAQAASHWVRSLFPEHFSLSRPFAHIKHGVSPNYPNAPGTHKEILWVSRRNFEQSLLHQNKLHAWAKRRLFINEDELIKAFQEAILQWNNAACVRRPAAASPYRPLPPVHPNSTQAAAPAPPSCREKRTFYNLRVIELSEVPFYPHQLQAFATTSIFVASHGAALGNLMWLRPGNGTGVLELLHNAMGNQHYHNMAYFLGHHYRQILSRGTHLAVPQAVNALKELMDVLA